MLMVDRLPLQLTIDLHYTITPNKFHKEKNAHKPMADGIPIPPQIDHRSMLYHYIHTVSYIKNAHKPMADGPPPLQLTIDLCYIITPIKFQI